MRIVFRVDGGHGRGMGHLIRCLALAEQFKAYGSTAMFLTREQPAVLKAIQAAGYPYAVLSSTATLEEDLHFTLEKSGHASILIADSYHFSSDYLRRLNAEYRLVVAFDDLIDRFLPVDLILGNVYVSRDSYGSYLPKETILLAGPTYLPLRPCLQNLSPKQIIPQFNRILVTFGGEDPQNYTEAVIKALQEYPRPLKLEIILGPAYTFTNQCEAALAQSKHTYQIYPNPPAIVSLFQSADLAIATPSCTFWELLATGTPSLLIKIAANQTSIEMYAQEKQLAICTSLPNLCKTLQTYEDPEIRSQYSQRAQAFVDGRGARRSVEAILTRYLEKAQIKLKQADPDPESSDSHLFWEWRNDPLTRAMSKQTEWIPWETHRAWYAAAASNPHIHMRIAMENSHPVGAFRLENDQQGDAIVSINVSPEFRGHGKGKQILELGCLIGFLKLRCDTLTAAIKKDNLVSKNLFMDLGFKLVEEGSAFDTYVKTIYS